MFSRGLLLLSALTISPILYSNENNDSQKNFWGSYFTYNNAKDFSRGFTEGVLSGIATQQMVYALTRLDPSLRTDEQRRVLISTATTLSLCAINTKIKSFLPQSLSMQPTSEKAFTLGNSVGHIIGGSIKYEKYRGSFSFNINLVACVNALVIPTYNYFFPDTQNNIYAVSQEAKS